MTRCTPAAGAPATSACDVTTDSQATGDFRVVATSYEPGEGSAQVKWRVGRRAVKPFRVRTYLVASGSGGGVTYDPGGVCDPVAFEQPLPDPQFGRGCNRPDVARTEAAVRLSIEDLAAIYSQCCVTFAADESPAVPAGRTHLVGWVNEFRYLVPSTPQLFKGLLDSGVHEPLAGARARFLELYVTRSLLEDNLGAVLKPPLEAHGAVVRSDQLYASLPPPAGAYRSTVAHETGHSLGLLHALQGKRRLDEHLMFPTSAGLPKTLLDRVQCKLLEFTDGNSTKEEPSKPRNAWTEGTHEGGTP